MSIGIVKFVKADSVTMFQNQFTHEMMDNYVAGAGLNGRVVNLSADVQAFAYNTNGEIPVPSTTIITASGVNTEGTPYYEFFVDGVSVQNSVSPTYTYTPKASYSDMPDKVEVRLRENSTTGTIYDVDFISLFGVQAGSDAITIILSNDSHTIPFTTAGVGTYTGSGTDINVWEGAVPLPIDNSSGYDNSSFRVTASGTNITLGTETQVDDELVYTMGDYTAMLADVAKVTFNIIVKNKAGVETSFVKLQSISKSKQGATGPAGESTSGMGILFRGEWNPSDTYYLADQRVDVVFYEDNYYLCLETNSNQVPSEEPLYWSLFDEEFSSVATGLLLAQDATIVKTLVMGTDDGIHTGQGTIRSASATGILAGDGFFIVEDSVNGGLMRVGKIVTGALSKGFYWNGTEFTVAGEINADSGAITGTMTIGSNLTLDGSSTGVITGGLIRTSSGNTKVELDGATNKIHFHFVDSVPNNKVVYLDGFAMSDEAHVTATDRFLVLAEGASRNWSPTDPASGYNFLQLHNVSAQSNEPYIRMFRWAGTTAEQKEVIISPSLLTFYKDSSKKYFEAAIVSGNFVLQWGAVGSDSLDTNLYRSGVNELATDDLLKLANKITNPTSNVQGLTFGGTVADTPDVNLYRSAENVLKTDDSLNVAVNAVVEGDIIQDDVVRPYISVSGNESPTVVVTIKCKKFDNTDSANHRMLIHWWISATEYGPPNKDIATESGGDAGCGYGSAAQAISPEAIDDKVLNTAITDSDETVTITFAGNSDDASLVFYLMAEVQGIVYSSEEITLYYQV